MSQPNFPNSPQPGDTYTYSGSVWTWTGAYWRVLQGVAATGGSIVPAANVAYDLGSDSLRWRDLYLSGNSLIIGGATLTATGSALTLPAGSTLGGQNLATSGDVSTGGGPKITNLQVTSNVYVVLDDTAVDLTGGFVKLTGTNFVSGCMVYVASTPANSTTFVSTTEVRAQLPATAAGTYPVYLVNPDGGTAIRVPGLTFSASPAWQTGSSLGEQYDGVVLTLPVVATDATVYTLTSGSLPPGLSLNSNTGVISGTVSGVANDTVYSFTITATDAQLQDSPRTFTVTITVSDPYFKLTTLLLSGSAISANTVVRDSSTNNFNLTVYGDARASNFTPYGTAWSAYLSGSTTSGLTIAGTGSLLGSGLSYTFEGWFRFFATNVTDNHWIWSAGSYPNRWTIDINVQATTIQGRIVTENNAILWSGSSVAYTFGSWVHISAVNNAAANTFTFYFNGINAGSTTAVSLLSYASHRIGIQATNIVHASSIRLISGQALYTGNYTPGTATLTTSSVGTTGANVAASITGTVGYLLCHTNRFLDDTGKSITISGTPQISSSNPFNITNTGVNGSMYFDGTGDYVTAPSNAVFGPSGDFTFESWLYWTGGSNENTLFCVDVSGGINIGLAFGTGGANWGIGRRALAVDNEFGAAPIKFTWNHLAVSRQSGTIRAFVNGRLVFSGANTVSYVAGPPGIACIATASTNILQGYISDARFVSAAVYTANFTPATSSLTAITNTQLLTLQYDQPHNNHTFLDSSSNQFLITRSGNASQGTFSPFSQAGWSNYFVANNANTVTAATAAGVAFGTGDFCQEFFLYATSYTGTWRIISYASVSGTASLLISSGAVLGADTGVGGLNTGITLPANTWFHLAYTRQSGRVRIFVNGVLQYNFADTTNYSTSQSVYIGGYPGYTQSWDGYISNARIIKGSVPAAYQTSSTTNGTSVFTPPTGPLTAVTGTELLTCQSNRFVDNNTQTTAKTITLTSSPQVQAFSPFAPTAVYNPVSHGGSGYVDGSGDYFILTNESAYDFGDGNFSIDFWYYPLSAQGYGGIYMRDGQDQPLGIYSGTSITPAWPECSMSVGTTTTWFATGINTSGVQKYAWNHIAFTRVGNTFRAFTNGVLSSVVTASGTMGSGGTPWIGKNGTAAGLSELSMYLSGFRMTKGGIPTLFSTSSTTTGTTIFAVPTQPFTANDLLTGGSLSILANFADAAILDSTGRTVLETVADAKSSSVITKFTGGSMSFDGTGDYIIMPDVLTGQFGTGDFTVEYWDRHGSQGTNYAPQVGTLSSGTGSGSWRFGTFSNLGGVYLAYHNGTSFIDVVFGSTVYNDNIWRHFALSRQGTTVRAFVDGVQVGSNQTVSQNFNSSNRVILGAELTSPTYFTGYIADLRITKGYARYTANFTAPTAPARLK